MFEIFFTLFQKLRCEKYYDLEAVEFIYGGVEVNNSMNRITHLFIQPNAPANSMPVLPPNSSTLQGLEMVFTSEKRLRRTADFASHSMNYISYLTGYSTNQPMCLACTVKSNAPPVELTYEQVVKDMVSFDYLCLISYSMSILGVLIF